MTETTHQERQLAEEALGWFETATASTGREYLRLRDGRPEWLYELVREAHGRDPDGSPTFLPDDWRYGFARLALAQLADGEVLQTADDHWPYTSERLAWVGSHLFRPSYCDHGAISSAEVCRGLVARLGAGMMAEASEVFGIVRRGLLARLGELDATHA